MDPGQGKIIMKYEHTDGRDNDFIKLCHMLDKYLDDIVGGSQNRCEYIPYNTLDDIKDVILVYDGDEPVGCASFKRYEDGIAEAKRVFIREEYRGRGISRKLMSLMEERAREKGFERMILETGEVLVEAMELYRKTGYTLIENYGPYRCMAGSICMGKDLQ